MKVLVIAIHMDDAECITGTMAQLIEKGAEVTYLNIKHYMHYKGGSPEADAQSMRGAELIGAKKMFPKNSAVLNASLTVLKALRS